MKAATKFSFSKNQAYRGWPRCLAGLPKEPSGWQVSVGKKRVCVDQHSAITTEIAGTFVSKEYQFFLH